MIAIAASLVIPAKTAHADSFRADQWYLKTLRITQAHTITKGAGVKVAVIDTGVYPHPDVRRNLLAGTDLVSGNNRDGRIDDDGHGTNMASIIAAHGRGRSDGVLGIAPSARILPVKITNRGNSMPAKTMAAGVRWASEHGATVINVSAETGPAFELADAIQAAVTGNIVVVAGVGNTSKQAIIAYPAAIDGVLVVGSVNRADESASFSIHSPKVQICAPGVDITTADKTGEYVDIDGTSASTAVVSGAAALLRARFPDLPANEIVHRLVATADDVGPPGRDDECGFGVVNVMKALTTDVPPLAGSAASPAVVPAKSSSGAATTSPITAFTPQGEADDDSTAVLLGGLGGVGLALGALAFFSLRRRRNF
ncbi:type VII secretion-associated serine protease mycosin [Actinoplanes sp. TBRC 11911]|uniref:type VII secretion-associated serine protease mycosin n=1 Tax=Actinoplanes sp. TBRC 11911 TaxID=2729386 RepID=UPI00145DA572|nr:type VII secretion-associated serine protease mycosin [Actinoplanes sp. TBRC 11911]NMO50373.1 type VII secretion-associated serine protease mycosin [Actinoplanes sp. TBRC 11911]